MTLIYMNRCVRILALEVFFAEQSHFGADTQIFEPIFENVLENE